MTARERLTAWRESLGVSRATLGERLGCDGSFLGHIEHDRRMPGRRLANAIEIESASWEDGPILSTEWDQVADAEVA